MSPTVRWPEPLAGFRPDLADREIAEWPAIVDLLAGRSPHRILMLRAGSEPGTDRGGDAHVGDRDRRAANVYESGPVFRDPEHFDFTLTRPESAAGVGFQPDQLRLDWSEFYVRASDAQSKSLRKGLEFVPIDLASSFNGGLTDDVAGDGRGGWTDQGPRDLRHLPVGRQRFDGVPYDLGTRERGGGPSS